MVKPYEVQFTVNDSLGNPIEWATVYVENDFYLDWDSIDRFGELIIELPAGNYSYTVRASGFEESSEEFTVPTLGGSPVSMILAPMVTYPIVFTISGKQGLPCQASLSTPMVSRRRRIISLYQFTSTIIMMFTRRPLRATVVPLLYIVQILSTT